MQIGSRTLDVGEIQKLIPQLEQTIEKQEKIIQQQQSTIQTEIKKTTEYEKQVKILMVCLI